MLSATAQVLPSAQSPSSAQGAVPALPGQEARLAYRAGKVGVTAGVAPGFVQGNLAILPEKLASAFHRFCQLNPKPCPIIGMSEVGDPRIPALGIDLDIRTDLPRYRIWRGGQLTEEPTDIMAHWRDDLVAFVIGCSFSFEEALIADGLKIRHIEEGRNVPMYRTNVPCASAGPFAGPLVVSMRPFKPADAIRAIQITTRFPAVHGAPVHFGKPELIGIKDVAKPDYGDAVSIQSDEVPVFWACGVTPQSVILQSRPDFAITHAPGYMLVTDVRNSEFSIQ
ncbi:putative hydro-lyase [Bradyrhizobium sp. G127]|uniref:putative hydro-lyase n=1 Tax=Bradyrhizobium sp. G127 TaxID=2904800 RepID=UPI001F39F927|nr:putative hydro-lyase [Bradyrhizobium sp. G127]MCF2522858.1 putative hydro-lyase [Bradyrhizobium sp. G127]